MLPEENSGVGFVAGAVAKLFVVAAENDGRIRDRTVRRVSTFMVLRPVL